MKHTVRTLLLASAVGLALPAAALAGSWEGPYAGLYGAYINTGNWSGGAQLGYNFDLGNSVYAGPEFDLMYIPSSGNVLGSAAARVGYALTPDLFGYGELGLARNFNTSVNAWMVGGGLEYMVADPVSLKVGVDRYQVLGGGAVNWVAKAGVVWHF